MREMGGRHVMRAARGGVIVMGAVEGVAVGAGRGEAGMIRSGDEAAADVGTEEGGMIGGTMKEG
jgi:hypothetical protein